MFKIGDYVIHDRHGVVLHITNGMEKAVINSQKGYRKATEFEIEQYHAKWICSGGKRDGYRDNCWFSNWIYLYFHRTNNKNAANKINTYAKHYSITTGIPAEEILNSWEENRTYWYMNYYQDSNQPEIKNVRVFNTVEEMMQAIGNKEFRCPSWGGITTNPYECNSGKEMSKGKTCDWKVYGLFGDLDKGVYVFIKEKLKGGRIFMPISWE